MPDGGNRTSNVPSMVTPHRPFAVAVRIPRKQHDVALPRVIPLSMEMVDVVAQRPPQGALAEEDYLGQAPLLLDRPYPALRIGIQVRAVRRQRERFNLRVTIMQEITTIPQRGAIVM
jgi:hypothetical protein